MTRKTAIDVLRVLGNMLDDEIVKQAVEIAANDINVVENLDYGMYKNTAERIFHQKNNYVPEERKENKINVKFDKSNI